MTHEASPGDQLWTIWQRLGPHWGPYFTKAGSRLNRVSKERFLERLNETIEINRKLEGLEEFSNLGCRGVEPADPVLSLFYRIFASPHVKPLANDEYYPTMADLEVID